MASYVESTDRPNQSRIAGSDVAPGEAVAPTGSNTVRPFDGSQDTLGEFLGVADNPLTGDQIAVDDDDSSPPLYEAAEDDRVIYNGDADGDLIKIRTAEDTGGNEPVPAITDGTVVGFVDTSAGSLSSTSEYHGRLVEEGYTDGDATTYNRANGNFIPVGVAYRDEGEQYDTPVRIEVNRDL